MITTSPSSLCPTPALPLISLKAPICVCVNKAAWTRTPTQHIYDLQSVQRLFCMSPRCRLPSLWKEREHKRGNECVRDEYVALGVSLMEWDPGPYWLPPQTINSPQLPSYGLIIHASVKAHFLFIDFLSCCVDFCWRITQRPQNNQCRQFKWQCKSHCRCHTLQS